MKKGTKKVAKKYKKPEVVTSRYSPDPVEAGCCLQSCGGSPISTQTEKNLSREAKAALATLEQANVNLAID